MIFSKYYSSFEDLVNNTTNPILKIEIIEITHMIVSIFVLLLFIDKTDFELETIPLDIKSS